MKKGLKIIGWIVAICIVLSIVVVLLTRFVFREQIENYLDTVERTERIGLLREAAPYAPDVQEYRFTYAGDTVRAREIGTYFRLDTLDDAAASTWERTLAMARFVSRNIPHANQRIYPEKSNAVALWEYSRTIEPAFNCRLHAIMLHEILLAGGITNRFVTCLPADSLDQDCHVVNIVWLPEHRKWAMIDSDMQAYATTPDGTPLSLEEMRRRFIAGEPIAYHPLLADKDLDFYDSYWAKNLYWFSCWEDTGYDRETGRRTGEGRIVALVSPGFGGFNLGDGAILTTDAARFWSAPEGEGMILCE